MVLPSHTVRAKLQPILALPAVPFEADHLLHEIPRPGLFPIGFDGIDLSSDGGKIDAIFACDGT